MYAHRKPVLMDAIIWIAATACGFAVYRPYSRVEDYALHSPLILDSTPVVSTWTLALVILRLQQPRPRLRRLFRQPGMAACSTLLIAMIGFYTLRYISLRRAAEGSEFQGQSFGWWFPLIFRETLYLNGFCILVVWLNLAISGRWNAEKSWIDRLGRLLAIYWIGISLVTMFQIL